MRLIDADLLIKHLEEVKKTADDFGNYERSVDISGCIAIVKAEKTVMEDALRKCYSVHNSEKKNVKYGLSFTNNVMVTFNFWEDIDLHKLDHTKPIVFNNVWVNPNHLVFIEKMEEGEGNEQTPD